MSLGDHLEELRARLILALLGLGIATTICLVFGSWIIAFLERPYFKVMRDQPLITLSPTDGLTCYMTIGVVAGVILASPWILYQAWEFVAAGLYPHEKRYVYMAMPFSVILFMLGSLLFVFWIASPTLSFLVSFNRSVMKLQSTFTFTDYISFMALTTLVFGLAFQTPLVVFILHKIGIVSLERLKSSRKYIFFGVVVVAAAAIPGSDLVSLTGLVVCMYGLFELGLILCWRSDRKKQKAAAAKAGDSCARKPD
jgi:sec-independent protein translocase protein TatC